MFLSHSYLPASLPAPAVAAYKFIFSPGKYDPYGLNAPWDMENFFRRREAPS